jgi:septum formation protein
MSASKQRFILASRSPRRVELLGKLGLHPEVIPADIDESPLRGEWPIEYVQRLAREKAKAVTRLTDVSNAVVIAADTTIDLDGTILGQPVDERDARRMLKLLSGRAHRVHTAVAVRAADGTLDTRTVTSVVQMAPITTHMLDWYISTGEPFGKAGAYAVQGAGGVLIEHVKGSMSAVVGLPLRETVELLGHALMIAE